MTGNPVRERVVINGEETEFLQKLSFSDRSLGHPVQSYRLALYEDVVLW